MKLKKYKPYIIGLLVTIALELTVFNFSFWKSIGNEPTDLSPQMEMDMNETGFIVHIPQIETEVSNIHFDIEVPENCPVRYDIAMTDEGNFYDYYLPGGVIASKTPTSFYTDIYSYGKVHTMTFTFNFDESETLKEPYAFHGITINAKRPLMFNLGRVLAVYLIFLFFFAVKDINPERGSRIRKISVAACVAVLVLFGIFLTGSHKFLNEASKPHHQQYKELAVSLTKGEVALDYVPEEGLVNAPNPYDTIYLQANNIDYKADYAYYNGRYYVYFGIVPEALLYLPVHIITGGDLPNHYAVLAFFVIFVLSTFLLYHRLQLRYAPAASWVSYLLISSFTVLSGTYAYIYFTADLYSVPVMAAIAFTTLGLYFWMKADVCTSPKLTALFIALGSLSMAWVAGCRPQLLLFSLLAVPIFYDRVFAKRELFSVKSIGRTVALILPYVIVAALLMSYNYLRFGSVTDFGATYSLTNNDMNLRGVSLSRMLLGLGSFLFQPPYVNGVFPFLHTVDLEYSYMGRMVTEHFLGGIITCNVLTWNLALIWHYRNILRAKKLRMFLAISVVSALVIGMLDANTAGVLQRYTADIAFGLILASSVLWLLMSELKNKLIFNILKVGLFVELIYCIMVVFNDASGITMGKYNPELFYMVQGVLKF